MRVFFPVLAALIVFTGCEADKEEQPTGPFAAELAELSGTCPSITGSGRIQLESNGYQREALVFLPEGGTTPESGILFNWYGTGGTAAQTDSWIDGQRLASDTGHVVVIPESLPHVLFEWEFRTEGVNDLVFYDDLRTCITREQGTNRDRVYTTGFSAGGLWSSFLVLHRGDTLAAAVVFSGGGEPVFDYETSASTVPVALVWGGEHDTWGSPAIFEVEFEVTSENLRDDLVADGHTVVQCVHQGGHRLPSAWRELLTIFTAAHRYGVESPFSDGDVSSLPSICSAAH